MNTISYSRLYAYGNMQMTETANKPRNGKAYLDKMNENISDNNRSRSVPSGGFSVQDAYMRMKSITRSIPGQSLQSQSSGDNKKVENENYVVELSDEIAGFWRIYDKKNNDYFTFDPNNTEVQKNPQTGKMYLIASDGYGGLMDTMPVNHSLYNTLSEFMNAEEMNICALSEQYTIVTDEITGIECLKIRGEEGGRTWMMISNEEQKEKLQELASVYRKNYPHLVQSDEMAMGMAGAEVCGNRVRTENGVILISDTGMHYMDDVDASKSWAVIYSSNDTYEAVMQAVENGEISGLNLENYSIWEEFFEERDLEFEKILSDYELQMLNRKKDEWVEELYEQYFL